MFTTRRTLTEMKCLIKNILSLTITMIMLSSSNRSGEQPYYAVIVSLFLLRLLNKCQIKTNTAHVSISSVWKAISVLILIFSKQNAINNIRIITIIDAIRLEFSLSIHIIRNGKLYRSVVSA